MKILVIAITLGIVFGAILALVPPYAELNLALVGGMVVFFGVLNYKQ